MFRIEWAKQFMRLSSQEKKGCFVALRPRRVMYMYNPRFVYLQTD